MWPHCLSHSSGCPCFQCLLLGYITECTMQASFTPASTEGRTDPNIIKRSSALEEYTGVLLLLLCWKNPLKGPNYNSEYPKLEGTFKAHQGQIKSFTQHLTFARSVHFHPADVPTGTSFRSDRTNRLCTLCILFPFLHN